MIAQHIASFFAVASLNQQKEELRDIRSYHYGDPHRAINRKKTAKREHLMVNSYEPDTHSTGTIICVRSSNRQKGHTHSIAFFVNRLIDVITQQLSRDPQSHIAIITTNTPPTHYTGEKVVIISDFLRNNNQLKPFLHACHKGVARGVTFPLPTPTGTFHNPLLTTHPAFVREIGEQ